MVTADTHRVLLQSASDMLCLKTQQVTIVVADMQRVLQQAKIPVPGSNCALGAHASPPAAMHCHVVHCLVMPGVCKELVRRSKYCKPGCPLCAPAHAFVVSHAGHFQLAGAHSVPCRPAGNALFTKKHRQQSLSAV